ncbi:MAG: hypothetical protein ACYC5N_10020, partial [Endomicrobiales bacterium]
LIGQGKPGNQNHMLAFVEKDFTELVDMNQDMRMADALRMPGIFQEFNDPDVVLVGFPEYIGTDEHSPVAAMAAHGDQSFVDQVQPFLESLGARFNYGHPDFYRTEFVKMQGGLSKDFTSEDMMGGQNAVLRGGKIVYVKGYEMIKLREAGFNTTFGMFEKFSSGSSQAFQSFYMRDINKAPHLGGAFDRSLLVLSHFFGGPGFYWKEPLVKRANFAYILLLIFMGMSGFSAFPLEISLGIVGIFLFSQAITFTGLMKSVFRLGFLKGIGYWFKMTVQSAPFYQAHVLTHTSGTEKGMTGLSNWVNTGRGPGLEHVPLFSPKTEDSTVYNFEPSHLTWSLTSAALAALGIAIWWNPSLLLSFFFLAFPLSGYLTPVLMNPGSTPMDATVSTWARLYKQDFKGWRETLRQGGTKDAKGNLTKLNKMRLFVHGALMLGVIMPLAFLVTYPLSQKNTRFHALERIGSGLIGLAVAGFGLSLLVPAVGAALPLIFAGALTVPVIASLGIALVLSLPFIIYGLSVLSSGTKKRPETSRINDIYDKLADGRLLDDGEMKAMEDLGWDADNVALFREIGQLSQGHAERLREIRSNGSRPEDITLFEQEVFDRLTGEAKAAWQKKAPGEEGKGLLRELDVLLKYRAQRVIERLLDRETGRWLQENIETVRRIRADGNRQEDINALPWDDTVLSASLRRALEDASGNNAAKAKKAFFDRANQLNKGGANDRVNGRLNVEAERWLTKNIETMRRIRAAGSKQEDIDALPWDDTVLSAWLRQALEDANDGAAAKAKKAFFDRASLLNKGEANDRVGADLNDEVRKWLRKNVETVRRIRAAGSKQEDIDALPWDDTVLSAALRKALEDAGDNNAGKAKKVFFDRASQLNKEAVPAEAANAGFNAAVRGWLRESPRSAEDINRAQWDELPLNARLRHALEDSNDNDTAKATKAFRGKALEALLAQYLEPSFVIERLIRTFDAKLLADRSISSADDLWKKLPPLRRLKAGRDGKEKLWEDFREAQRASFLRLLVTDTAFMEEIDALPDNDAKKGRLWPALPVELQTILLEISGQDSNEAGNEAYRIMLSMRAIYGGKRVPRQSPPPAVPPSRSPVVPPHDDPGTGGVLNEGGDNTPRSPSPAPAPAPLPAPFRSDLRPAAGEERPATLVQDRHPGPAVPDAVREAPAAPAQEPAAAPLNALEDRTQAPGMEGIPVSATTLRYSARTLQSRKTLLDLWGIPVTIGAITRNFKNLVLINALTSASTGRISESAVDLVLSPRAQELRQTAPALYGSGYVRIGLDIDLAELAALRERGIDAFGITYADEKPEDAFRIMPN